MSVIDSIQSTILDLPPSCVEFCAAAPEYFVVGTYFLEKKEQQHDATTDAVPTETEESTRDENKTQKRSGSLIVFRLEQEKFALQTTTPTPYAILDLHFSPHDPTLLAVAGSTGCISLFRLSSASLTHERTLQVLPDPSILVLSLAWHPTNATKVGFTASNGQVCVCDVSGEDGDESVQPQAEEVLSHELEAWTLAFLSQTSANGTETEPDNENENENKVDDDTATPDPPIFSGGDDATLRFSSTPSHPELTTQWIDRRSHGAGVTAILPLAHENEVTVTGSYDDRIRVLRTPVVGRKTVLKELDLGGGVWRLKVMRQDEEEAGRYVILASCMHAGARIVELKRGVVGDDDGWDITVLGVFEEHKSMNYGSDFQPGGEQRGRKNIISTSFYDKLLCLWQVDI